MGNKRVTPVRPIDPVSGIHPVHKGNTYFRQLEQWRIMSEVFADAGRFKEELLRKKKQRDR